MVDKKRVLVIDDDPRVIESIHPYLEKESLAISHAKDGKSAIKLFYSINPSVIILDLVLPDMSGEDICRQIRQHSNVPIIVVTGKTDDATVLTSFKIGADQYVPKPFSPRELTARVKAALRRYESSTDSSFNNYLCCSGIDIDNIGYKYLD
jgi:DNA-binding response OmpR family regulator